MNKGQVIGGIILLAAAALLAVVNLRLPSEDLMFDVGFGNMPWLPVAVMAVIGVVLIVLGVRSSGEKVEKAADVAEAEHLADPEKIKLNKRLENVGWGVFLVMLGCRLLVSEDVVPGAVWTIGLGVIWLGLNLARYNYGIRMSGFTTFLGVLAIVVGVAELFGFDAGGAAFFIILGIGLILKPWFDRRQMFGKVEEG
jgi:hypothetical protein